VVEGPLVDSHIAAGKRFITLLDEAKLAPSAAFWLHEPEWGKWRLVVVYPETALKGSRQTYLKLHPIFQGHVEDLQPLKFDDITALSPDDPRAKAVSSLVRVEGMGGVRLTSNMVNGVFIDDAYVYRSATRRNGNDAAQAVA
jgi:hypothetical protein